MAKVKIVKDTAERWLLTYADLMNLLLIFFIILYAMSNIDKEKVNAMAAAMRSAFGQSSAADSFKPATGSSVIPLPSIQASPVVKSSLESAQMEEVKQQVEKMIKTGDLQGKMSVTVEERGIKISINTQYTFKPGSAEMDPHATPTIQEIAKVLEGVPGNHIRVEGFTDNDPINTVQFPSNWELSTARSTTVVRLILANSKVNPNMIEAAGFGQYNNIAPNDTPENKKKNRRVDIIILSTKYDTDLPASINNSNASNTNTNAQ